MASVDEYVNLADLENFILKQGQLMEKLIKTTSGAKELSLDGLESMAKGIKSKLKDLGYREKTTAQMLAKIHAHYLAGNVSGQDIFLFLSFLFLRSGMPMRSMQDFFSQKTKIKQVKGLKEEQLPVVKAIADNLNDDLVQAIALAL